MKKVYVAPQTEAIEVFADKVLMASPGGGLTPIYGTGSGEGAGDVM